MRVLDTLLARPARRDDGVPARCCSGPGSARRRATSCCFGSAVGRARRRRRAWGCSSCPYCLGAVAVAAVSGGPPRAGRAGQRARRRRHGAPALNLRLLRVPPADPPPVAERVAVLLPVRDEAHRVEPCLRSLLAQRGVRDLDVVVLDDGSTDGTADVVRRWPATTRGSAVVPAAAARGWLGKPWACAQLAAQARPTRTCWSSSTPTSCSPPTPSPRPSRCCAGRGSTCVSPYPRQVAGRGRAAGAAAAAVVVADDAAAAAGRAVAAAVAGRGQRSAARGRRARPTGGPAGTRPCAPRCSRTSRCCGRSSAPAGAGTVVDGTPLATCRMYDGWPALRDGYAKSLWAAFGSPAGARRCVGALDWRTSCRRWRRCAARGRAARLRGRRGRTGRSSARRAARVWPDALAHPVSVGASAGSPPGRCAATGAGR